MNRTVMDQLCFTKPSNLEDAGHLGTAIGKISDDNNNPIWFIGLIFNNARLAQTIAQDIRDLFNDGSDSHDDLKLAFVDLGEGRFRFSVRYFPRLLRTEGSRLHS